METTNNQMSNYVVASKGKKMFYVSEFVRSRKIEDAMIMDKKTARNIADKYWSYRHDYGVSIPATCYVFCL